MDKTGCVESIFGMDIHSTSWMPEGEIWLVNKADMPEVEWLASTARSLDDYSACVLVSGKEWTVKEYIEKLTAFSRRLATFSNEKSITKIVNIGADK